MAAHTWRRLVSTVVNACIESSLALDPCAYAAFMRASDPAAPEQEAVSSQRDANRVPAPVAARGAVLQLDVVAR